MWMWTGFGKKCTDMPSGVQLGSGNYDGVLMYVVHQGITPEVNHVISAANQVWSDENDHPAASMYGVGETDISQFPDAEILSQTRINTIPTLLFCRVEDNVITSILSRLEGNVSEAKIRSEFKRILSKEPSNESGEGSGDDDLFEADGKGGLGIGLGGALGGCPKFLPKWLCDFPFWILIAILAVIVILIIRRR